MIKYLVLSVCFAFAIMLPVPVKVAYDELAKNRTIELSDIVARVFASKGCKHVYIDMGTNTGVQILKWFFLHDERFDKFKMKRYFKEANGSGCAIGFEANPRYQEHLRDVSERIWGFGHPNFLFAALGASDKDGETEFREVRTRYMFEGSGFHSGDSIRADKGKVKSVKTIDIARFILNFVKRTSDLVGYIPKIIIKSDIEGEEYNVIPALLRPNSFLKNAGGEGLFHTSVAACYIDLIAIEWHLRYATNLDIANNITSKWVAREAEYVSRIIPACKLMNVVSVDDEKHRFMNVINFLEKRKLEHGNKDET